MVFQSNGCPAWIVCLVEQADNLLGELSSSARIVLSCAKDSIHPCVSVDDRAIANDADLIIADEPTASLETKQGFEIIRLLHEYAKNHNSCVVVASHDLRIVEYSDRVIPLKDGMIEDNSVTDKL